MIFIGDIHGQFTELARRLIELEIRDTNLIQVGDFGIGFLPPEEETVQLRDLDWHLQEWGNTLYVIRGNHDNPTYFTPNSSWGASNIRPVPDYSLLTIDGRRLLMVGGAISIDRLSRTEGSTWWLDEKFRLDIASLNELDLSDLWAVVTHAAPNFVDPLSPSQLVAHYAEKDSRLLQELKSERADLTELFKTVTSISRPEYWIYGHYHFYSNTHFGGTRFVALAELQFYSALFGGQL